VEGTPNPIKIQPAQFEQKQIRKVKKVKSKENVEKATRMTDLIEYQEGSVVSRTIIDKEAGTVTLFRFRRRAGVKRAHRAYDAMVYALKEKFASSYPVNPWSLTR